LSKSQNSTAQNVAEDASSAIQNTQHVGPVEFIVSNRHAAAKFLIELARSHEGRHVHLANAYTVALADKSMDYRCVLSQPAINFPDGKPISWISAMSRHSPRLEQVRGPQLFLDTFDLGRRSGIRHFLLGSTPAVLEALETNLTDRFPGVLIVGAESPPFRLLSADEHEAQDERILSSGADIVWVGLGTPKQDFEAQRLAGRLPVVAVAIGAAFDFAAGSSREAPNWMTNVGLEWAYRLASEPKRLWKRYLFGNARFLLASLVRTYPESLPGHETGGAS
jgi:N-acetylglucosaminyldiphosphoundecaprenol N-acetyl-beta-D-mannosaminyltransferase